MRAAMRDLSPFWYATHNKTEPAYDEYGNEISESRTTYDEPVKMFAVISPAVGTSQTQQFGNLENYDKVLWFVAKECPFDESSVLFIDREPEHNLNGDLVYDYVVRRIAVANVFPGQKAISVAVRKVNVS